MSDPVTNFAKCVVSGGYTSSATTITLQTGEGAKLPQPSIDGAFNMVWWNYTDYKDPSDDPEREIVRVTARTNDVLTVTRGQESITATSKNTSAKVYYMMIALTKKTYDDIITDIDLKADITYVDLKTSLAEGQMANGKIVPSVASNNLTLALKGADGNDPSVANPVYIKINGVVQTITSALSVTKNAGTNWFSSGATGLATKEIDYFAYLGYNTTDGVVIGFARIPYANKYSNFSTTTTSEIYCAISTITNAAANDAYVVIGRFAATLSATASFNWSVPTYTPDNLIQRPIFETRMLTWQPTVGGFSSAPNHSSSNYIIQGKLLRFDSPNGNAGTSNATSYTLTAPFGNYSGYAQYGSVAMAFNNSAATGGAGWSIANLSATITLNNGDSATGWTASGTKYAKPAGVYAIG